MHERDGPFFENPRVLLIADHGGISEAIVDFTWSPDGRYVLYTLFESTDATNVWWLDATTGATGRGILLLVISVVAMMLDNVLRPILIRKGADLPLLAPSVAGSGVLPLGIPGERAWEQVESEVDGFAGTVEPGGSTRCLRPARTG